MHLTNVCYFVILDTPFLISFCRLTISYTLTRFAQTHDNYYDIYKTGQLMIGLG